MEWLDNFLQFASGAAAAGPPIKASGERYASVSCHLAMALHDALRDADHPAAVAAWLAELANAVGHTDVEIARAALRDLVLGVPFLCNSAAFQAPNGLYDLPQILATAHWGRHAEDVGFVPAYKRLLQRLNWLLLTIKTEWVRGGSVDPTPESIVALVAAERPSDDFAVPARLAVRLVAMGRDLMPSPIAVVAAVGVDYEAPTDSVPFAAFVAGVHAALVNDPGRTVLSNDSTAQGQYLVHMNRFLSDSGERLAMAVLPCDRVPIVAPWYASIVLGTRAYAHVLARQLGALRGQTIDTRVRFTLFSLLTIADESLEDELHGELAEELQVSSLRPVTSLLSSRSKSMYVPSGAQDSEWWLLLRATLSGITVAEADEVAEALLVAAAGAPAVARNAVLLCVMMHTQTGMRIAGHQPDARAAWPKSFPLAALVRRVVDPVSRQTPLDLLAATYSGTLDLDALASDDLAFNAPAQPRMAHAWTQYLDACCYSVELPDEPVGDEAHIAGTVQRFCDALRAVGMDWIDVCLDAAPDPDADPAEQLDEAIAATPDEMRGALHRVAAASSTLNCGAWLGVAFHLSFKLEQRARIEGERALIRSPLWRDWAAKTTRDGYTGDDVLKDEAWLRTHFCYLAEQALHSARNGGLWSAGNHLVLVGWLSTDRWQADEEKKDHGVRLFARAITNHTVRATEPLVNQARLITPERQRSIVRSGWDSIVECARLFERELHACTARETDAHAERADAARVAWAAAREAAAGDPDQAMLAASPAETPALPPPALPIVLRSSAARAHAGAIACGPGRFEKDSILALDAASDAAMHRLRVRCQDRASHRQILTCSTDFAHGACVAVVAIACDDDDIRHARETERRGHLPSKRAKADATLLARVARFAAGKG